MFELNSKKVELGKDNSLISKNINLDKDLDCFILLSSNDEKFWELLINKILDSIIDKISVKNYYNDFSISLQNINLFINNYLSSNSEKIWFDVIVWILNKNNFIFSNQWKSSCYLLKTDKELVEATKNNYNKKEFSFISNWELNDWEIIILSTKRLLNYLSQNDFVDWLNWEWLNWFNDNLKDILLWEDIDENILLTTFNYYKFSPEQITKKSENIKKIKNKLYIFLDNNVSKNIYIWFLKISEKIKKQSKIIKNILIIIWIVISFTFIYTSIASILNVTSTNEKADDNKEKIIQAKEYLKIASKSTNNPDIFQENIKKAEELIESVKWEHIFLNDLEKIVDDINIVKKKYNKIEIFNDSQESVILWKEIENPINVLKANSKTYIIKDKSIIWPVIPNQEAKETVFPDLWKDEFFIDSISLWDDIFLLTNTSKIVNFSKSWYFKFYDVKWQQKWEDWKSLATFWQNIYLLWNDNQIYKHTKIWNIFDTWEWYLKPEDNSSLWNILDIAIDWWIYILKDDLTIVKFFKSPEYKLESLILNKLPDNYNRVEWENNIKLKSWSKLSYLYMLLNNKILIFKPNTKNIKDTKSLNFVWQIESKNNKIKDFFVDNDWEIIILNEKWLYKLSFGINEDTETNEYKLMLK